MKKIKELISFCYGNDVVRYVFWWMYHTGESGMFLYIVESLPLKSEYRKCNINYCGNYFCIHS